MAGLLSIPLVFLSLLGFLKILGFRFFEWKTQILFWTMGLGNVIAIVLFTQVWPAYYILMLIAGAAISLAGLYVYGALAKRQRVPSVVGTRARQVIVRRRMRLVQGLSRRCFWASLIVVLTKVPQRCGMARTLSIWRRGLGIHAASRINIFTSAGFFILVTALVCYLFRVQKRATPPRIS